MKAQLASTLAQLAVRKVQNRYEAAMRAIAEDKLAEDLSDPDVVSAALHQYSDGILENIARETANQAFQSGRGAGLQDVQTQTGKKLVWRRASVLEDSTCTPCAQADGAEIDGPDADLSVICEGGALCRCLPYANLDEVAS